MEEKILVGGYGEIIFMKHISKLLRFNLVPLFWYIPERVWMIFHGKNKKIVFCFSAILLICILIVLKK